VKGRGLRLAIDNLIGVGVRESGTLGAGLIFEGIASVQREGDLGRQGALGGDFMLAWKEALSELARSHAVRLPLER
jgi:hypothetical protein